MSAATRPPRKLDPGLRRDDAQEYRAVAQALFSIAPEALEQTHELAVRNGLGVMPALALHVARGDHGIDDGFFGGLHGLAGTSHLLGIFPSMMLEGAQALTYLLAFLVGSMAAMAGFGLLAGRVVSRHPRHLQTSLRAAGAFTLLVGCVWIWQSVA